MMFTFPCSQRRKHSGLVSIPVSHCVFLFFRVVSNSFSPASVFLSRQFWSSVKLLDNMSKFQGLLNDRPLQALALDALLTRYSLMGVRIASDLPERVERAKGVSQYINNPVYEGRTLQGTCFLF